MKLTHIDHPLLNRAVSIAIAGHAGRRRKDGQFYITHPFAVMDLVETVEEKIIAVLHDIVEDTNVSLEELRREFPSDIVDDIDAVTRRDGESYREFIQRIKIRGGRAVSVKLADIDHNLEDQSALSADERDFLTRRYMRALEQLYS